jgi:uncharacterized protein YceK
MRMIMMSVVLSIVLSFVSGCATTRTELTAEARYEPGDDRPVLAVSARVVYP